MVNRLRNTVAIAIDDTMPAAPPMMLRRKAPLNTSAMTFFNLDWANASAQCFVCDKCGRIEWFLPK